MCLYSSLALAIDILDYVNGIGNGRCMLIYVVHSYMRVVYVGVISAFVKVVRFTLAEELE